MKEAASIVPIRLILEVKGRQGNAKMIYFEIVATVWEHSFRPFIHMFSSMLTHLTALAQYIYKEHANADSFVCTVLAEIPAFFNLM